MTLCGGGRQETFYNVPRLTRLKRFWHEHELTIVSWYESRPTEILRKTFHSAVEKDRVTFRIRDFTSLLVSRTTQLCHNRIYLFQLSFIPTCCRRRAC